MKPFDILLIAKDSFRANKLRTLLTVSAVTIGIGAMLFLLSLGRGLQEITVNRITTSESLRLLQVSKGGSEVLVLNDATLETFKNVPNVASVSPRRSFTVVVASDATSTESVVHGVGNDFIETEIDALSFGKRFSKETVDDIVISTQLAKLLTFTEPENALGKKVSTEMFIPQSDGEFLSVKKSYTISGVVEAGEDNVLYAPIASFGKEADSVDYQSVKILVSNPDYLTAARTAIQNLGFSVESPADTVSEVTTVFNVAQGILVLFGAIALVVASIGMFNTLTISLLERTHDVGIMKALGATNRDILGIFISEALIIGLLGGLMGLFFGWFVGFIVNTVVNKLASRFNGESLDLFMISDQFLWGLLVIALVLGLVTGLYPAFRASRLNPLNALRYE